MGNWPGCDKLAGSSLFQEGVAEAGVIVHGMFCQAAADGEVDGLMCMIWGNQPLSWAAQHTLLGTLCSLLRVADSSAPVVFCHGTSHSDCTPFMRLCHIVLALGHRYPPEGQKKKLAKKGAKLKLEPAAGMAEGDTQGSMGTAEAMGHTRSGL